MNEKLETEQKILLWKDKKLLAGVILVVLSFILGVYGKVIIVAKFYKPVELLTGISVYAFSFVLLFIGVFLVGWETVKMIQQKIHYHVKRTVKRTYHHAKKLPKRGYHYTKELHKKSLDKITTTSKAIAEKIKK